MVRSLLESIQERRKKKELWRLFLPESGRFEKKKKKKIVEERGRKTEDPSSKMAGKAAVAVFLHLKPSSVKIGEGDLRGNAGM